MRWQDEVEQELRALIEQSAHEVTEMWRSGTISAGSSIDQISVLPCTPEAAALAYRVNHFEGGERPAAQPLFLETWVKREGQRYLLPHTAEKGSGM